jgi:hypothetical protein
MEEIVNEYPPPGQVIRPAASVRSTILTSSIVALRARGHFDGWSAALEPSSRDALLGLIAGTWVPLDLAMRHYDACDSLLLPHDEIVAIGQSVGTSAHQNLFHALKRIVSGAGVTPWTLAEHYERLFVRAFDGGGFRIARAGPKDSTIELRSVPMARSAYFRAAFCGVNMSALGLVTTRCYVRVSSVARSRDGFTVRVAWV